MNVHQPSTQPIPPPTTAWADLDEAGKCAAITTRYGTSTSQIADELSTTKNSIIGFARRRNIRLVPRPESQPRRSDMPWRAAFTVHPQLPETEWEPLAGATPIAEPTRRQCCWPVGPDSGAKQMFCGLPKAKGSYCEAHAKRAYKTSTPVNPGDFDQANELLRYLRDSEIKETTRVAFGRVGGQGEVGE